MDKINIDAYLVTAITPTGTYQVLRISSGAHKCQECGAIINIENGIIPGVGTHKELFEKHKMYKKYVLEQFYKEKDRTEEE